jgi:hypothetical protein
MGHDSNAALNSNTTNHAAATSFSEARMEHSAILSLQCIPFVMEPSIDPAHAGDLVFAHMGTRRPALSNRRHKPPPAGGARNGAFEWLTCREGVRGRAQPGRLPPMEMAEPKVTRRVHIRASGRNQQMLRAILSSLDIARRRAIGIGESPALKGVLRFADNAIRGAERARELTQRLLAFSRRQPLKPAPTDGASRVRAECSDAPRDYGSTAPSSRANTARQRLSGARGVIVSADDRPLRRSSTACAVYSSAKPLSISRVAGSVQPRISRKHSRAFFS